MDFYRRLLRLSFPLSYTLTDVSPAHKRGVGDIQSFHSVIKISTFFIPDSIQLSEPHPQNYEPVIPAWMDDRSAKIPEVSQYTDVHNEIHLLFSIPL